MLFHIQYWAVETLCVMGDTQKKKGVIIVCIKPELTSVFFTWITGHMTKPQDQ